ncbi:MAG: hypothetical protein VB064_05410 [Oscillospiraceae bacterium]|nr:hypothetical protein [Oscillospiraceae bacterium]
MDNNQEILKQAEFLYDATVKLIYNLALYTIGNSSMAEQITTDAFCDAFYRVTDRSDIELFMKKAIREVYKHGRKIKRLSYCSGLLCMDTNAGARRLLAALLDLDYNERYIILLFCWLRLSPKEIARIICLPTFLVKKRLYTSIRKLGFQSRENVACISKSI